MTDDWTLAWQRTQTKIEAHPLFGQLIREVAVAEQPTGAPARLRQNSLTYGAWWTRGSRWAPKGGKARRARLFASAIAEECHVLPSSPEGDRQARVYVAAREYVRARRVTP